MRIVSYNILNGGEGRADPLAEVIEAQRSDIVALVEADDPAVVDRIARRLGFDAITASGRSHAVALLSRWPIIETINDALVVEGIEKCLLRATVGRPGGTIEHFAIVHLHAHAREADERIREAEIAVLLDCLAGWRKAGAAHWVMGDFNANSPIQTLDPERCKASTRREWHENGGQIPRRAIARMLDAGYIDTLAAVAGESAGTMGTFSTRQPGQRVDHIFCHGVEAAKLRGAWIERDRLATYASDHYPVGVEVAD